MAAPSGNELNKGNIRRAGRAVLWNAILAVMLLWWSLAALDAPWGSLTPSPFIVAIAAFTAYALCTAASFVERKWIKWLLHLIPWAVMLPLAAVWMNGLRLWLNCIISIWNEIHRDGLSLFQTDETTQSAAAISALAAIAVAQIIWWITERRSLIACGAFAFVLMLLQLLTDSFLPLAWGLWLAAFIGLWMSMSQRELPLQSLRMWGTCTVVLLVVAFLGTSGEITDITGLRENTQQAVHELRYGQDTLPEGDLSDAAELNKGDKELLKVRTEQRKTIYLRAFEGAEYEDGVWQPLPGASYGGTYSGMLKWLSKQGFSPLTQSARYYSLCDQETAPESNTIDIDVTGGSRYYLYVPASAESVSASYKAKRDACMSPRGLFGARSYTVKERSSTRPSELTVWADWVAEPETDAQKAYAESAGMYRSFVYNSYTATDSSMKKLMDDVFWNDYTTENEGVYSAVQRIRTVLNERTTYTREPSPAPEGEDAIKDFLTGSRRGNSVLYASAAVEALRARGIPARYVEGYYIPQNAQADKEDGMISLSSQDAHAWPEVYFDGVGWMPVDVTPGYYYDALALRQMISLPDTVQQTATLDDGPNGGEEISIKPSLSDGYSLIKILRNTVLLLFGMAAAVVLLISAWYIITRLIVIISKYTKKRRYLRSDNTERALLLKKWIYAALAAHGFDACLGWKTMETDAEASERFEEVEPGEYSRVVSLLEKFMYGGEELEAFELRVIQAFYRKIFPVGGGQDRKAETRSKLSDDVETATE